ncbi:MAG: FYDLN acid domain-containing protein [Deltaproteobacteria bacterium]|nr:FYDLN acid domain-containing protein [Deltaproteobacteria bacterium]
MTDIKLGTKYDCPSCSIKFYDFGKQEPICPKCGTLYGEGLEQSQKKPAKTKAKAKAKPKAKKSTKGRGKGEEEE